MRGMGYSPPAVEALDRVLEAALKEKIDTKTKPLGSLGQLEVLALQLGLVQRTLSPCLRCPTILVCAADHGLTAEGVSPYPAAVTAQMVHNFIKGGAAINAFAENNGIALQIVNAGVATPLPTHPLLWQAPVAAGTANAAKQPAMTHVQTVSALLLGQEAVRRVALTGCNVIGFGDMGIGNTTSAALLMALFLERDVRHCVGRGAGVDAAQLQHKTAVAVTAWRRAKASLGSTTGADPLALLAEVGGFEIAAIAGGMLAAAAQRMIILVDGFIATAALLAARALCATVTEYCVFCHRSDEQAHADMLTALDAKPLLGLDLRLGEGTGAALAYPLLAAAAAFLNNMASFTDAAISQRRDSSAG